jgi:hypothetical protein
VTAPSLLLPQQDARRTRRDRQEVLTALIERPEFDPAPGDGVLKIPPTHPVFPWRCTVVDCARPRRRRYAMCSVHAEQWQEAEVRGVSRAQVLRTAERYSTLRTPQRAPHPTNPSQYDRPRPLTPVKQHWSPTGPQKRSKAGIRCFRYRP